MQGHITELAEDPVVRQLLSSRQSHLGVSVAINSHLEETGSVHRTSEASVRRWRRMHPDPAEGPAQSSEQMLAELRGKYEELRQLHDQTLRELAKAKLKTSQLTDAVYRAASEAAAALALPRMTVPVRDSRRKTPEVAVAVLSDWQLAKITPSYSSAVCEKRITEFAQRVIEITGVQRADHPVEEIHVWGLGDLVEGELIFPGQQYLIDASLYRQVCVDGPRILGTFLRAMAANFRKVTFHGVIGNHGALAGRSRRDMNPESNADRMLYRITEQLLAAQDTITWHIPEGDRERNWYAIDRIGKYSSLLIHGDQLRGYGGMPWYGLLKKVGGWRLGAIEEDFQDVYLGHYHQPTRVTLNEVTARCAGSPESHNTYAAEQLAAVGRPSQPLMFVNPEKGMVTAEYTVWLE